MTTDLEGQLRRVFAEDAMSAAPPQANWASSVRSRVRRQRLGLVGAGLALAALVPIGLALDSTGERVPVANVQQAPSAPTGEVGTEGSSLGSCAEEYSPAALTNREFAFDGTVVDVAPAESPGDPNGYVVVTYEVNEWFSGGAESAADVVMLPPVTGDSIEARTSYDIGSRLLVSGQLLRNGHLGGWPCGFIRHYAEDEASVWREAVAGR